MENISSPTSQVVTPLQSPNGCMRSFTQQHLLFLKPHRTTTPPISQASPLHPANDENYNTPTPSHQGANLEKFYKRQKNIVDGGTFTFFLH